MERPEQVEVTTPSGKKVVLRGYITNRIKQQLEAVFLKGARVSLDDAGEKDVQFDASVTIEATNRAIELLVVSIDGQEGKPVLDYVLDDLDEMDFEFIKREVNKIKDPLAQKTKSA